MAQAQNGAQKAAKPAKLQKLFKRVVPKEVLDARKRSTRDRQNRWQKANPEKRRQHRRKSRYGISPAEYERLFAEQQGRCAICEKEQDEPLAVDHDHATDDVRGLLCRLCNMTLGSARDSTVILERMVTYLERHHARRLRVI